MYKLTLRTQPLHVNLGGGLAIPAVCAPGNARRARVQKSHCASLTRLRISPSGGGGGGGCSLLLLLLSRVPSPASRAEISSKAERMGEKVWRVGRKGERSMVSREEIIVRRRAIWRRGEELWGGDGGGLVCGGWQG